jgi:hypothetical protein
VKQQRRVEPAIRPYRRDGYRSRRRIHIRVDDAAIGRFDALAYALGLSRAYLCDLILGIAVDEGGEWLRRAITGRVERALELRKLKYGSDLR